ncbi:transcriptional regulator, MarR family [Williamsia sterculiae]|uniref:Transcriptional regulator, MarR family n=1 Tax=Williamsia sterculiae TaxID=1344003 RepID=A0A1N7HF76_9NOCA|nr:transcriptional regulator, MarR family [Williamsia sterculiae]
MLLQRRIRRSLYAGVINDVHEAVDEGAYLILSGVARFGPVSAAALGAEVGVDRALVSRRARTLTKAGLLLTQDDPGDRRVTLLALTEEGERVVQLLRSRLACLLDDRLRDWSATDVSQLRRLLTRLVTAIDDSDSLD